MTNRQEALRGAVLAFAVALAGLAGMLVLILSGPEGARAVAAIGGLLRDPVQATTLLKWAAAADTLLPLGYGAGFCLMAIGLARDPHDWALAGAAVLAAILGMTFDFLENGFVLANEPIGALTTAKYGTLGLAGFLIGCLIPTGTGLQAATRVGSRIVAPPALAVLIAGLGPFSAPLPLILLLIVTFALLALTARQIAGQA
ncbi:MAG: hypothetical protein AAF919_14665 [Pseudomonadota bacterium]